MAIKMVVTDLNGTLLNQAQAFDRQWLQRLLTQMQQRQIYFVACSGNQYQHLQQLFAGLQAPNLILVAENGASIYAQQQQIFSGALSPQRLTRFVSQDLATPLLAKARTILVGRQAAYTLAGAPKALLAAARKFYDPLQEVANLTQVSDLINKISLAWDHGAPGQIVSQLNHYFKQELVAHDSGYGVIDVVRHDVGKLPAVQFLQQRWQISPAETVVFGDGANDQPLLAAHDQSYAMRNAPAAVQHSAQQVTAQDNEHSGVLATLAQLLGVH